MCLALRFLFLKGWMRNTYLCENSCRHSFTSKYIQTHTCQKNTKFHSNVIGKYINKRFHFHVSSLFHSVSACCFSWPHTYLYNDFVFLAHKIKNNTKVFVLCHFGSVLSVLRDRLYFLADQYFHFRFQNIYSNGKRDCFGTEHDRA